MDNLTVEPNKIKCPHCGKDISIPLSITTTIKPSDMAKFIKATLKERMNESIETRSHYRIRQKTDNAL